ncbi:WXG100-like domain-containing protein [Saccharopolyspora elongata]|uniref:Outer membrane channel protein CpnT-like N-terminal domain-containing protein n=1 Tax=Saccharopolyspora elongata TaxID=2530387 RepID=A0A4R4XTK1_9PSEU|nr:hypothetical protein [Saccharopolyspora elongata]TDD34901.1 hypothetical protein E1288_43900 [Saccharopolyspora elongata]
MAATDVSDDVQRLLEVLVGNDWPEGNPDELRAMAAGWRETVEHLGHVVELVNRGAAQVARALTGETADSFRAFIAPFLGEDGYLPQLALAASGFADALDGMALEIETLRIIIILLLTILAIDIAALIAAAVATFGASTAVIPAKVAATRTTITTVLRKAINQVLAHLAGSVLDQVGVTFFAQFIQICQGKRKGFDGGMLAIAAQNGAIGGAVGIGAGPLGNAIKVSGAKALGSHLFDGSVAKTWKGATVQFGANLPLNAGWGAAVGAAEAAAQDAASGASGDEVYGAENGAFTGALDAGRGSFNPHGKFSTSTSVYLDKGLNIPWRDKDPDPISTTSEPPQLPEIPKDDWTAWANETIEALHR